MEVFSPAVCLCLPLCARGRGSIVLQIFESCVPWFQTDHIPKNYWVIIHASDSNAGARSPRMVTAVCIAIYQNRKQPDAAHSMAETPTRIN